jgi:Holliday junction resolvasome RuvABC endonuclease subunit
MLYLALDQSKANSGWTMWNDGILINKGVISNKTCNEDSVLPYLHIMDRLKNIIAVYGPEHLFLEGTYVSMMCASALQSMHSTSLAVRLTAHECSVPYTVIKASAWQSFFLGWRTSTFKSSDRKKAIRRITETIAKMKFPNEHTADSAAIGLYGLYLLTGRDHRIEIPEAVRPKPPKKVKK